MRKKLSTRGSLCRWEQDRDASFLEDFANEFFTCSYFFKCIGEMAMTEGEELASRVPCYGPCCGPCCGHQCLHEVLEDPEEEEAHQLDPKASTPPV